MKKILASGISIVLLTVNVCRGSGTDSIPAIDTLTVASTALTIDSLVKANLLRLETVNPNDTAYFNFIESYDLIVTLNWEIMVVKVKSIDQDAVNYLYPLNPNQHSISREEISQIIYSDGGREVFHPLVKPEKETGIDRIILKEKKSWEEIVVVESADSIPSRLDELGDVDAVFEADKIKTTSEFLEKNALIILRKKAANLEGEYLLITNKKISRPYGEIPEILLEGKVYGTEQQEE